MKIKKVTTERHYFECDHATYLKIDEEYTRQGFKFENGELRKDGLIHLVYSRTTTEEAVK